MTRVKLTLDGTGYEVALGSPLPAYMDEKIAQLGEQAEHVRQIKAQAFYEYADYLDATARSFDHSMDEDDWDEHNRLTTCIRNWAERLLKNES